MGFSIDVLISKMLSRQELSFSSGQCQFKRKKNDTTCFVKIFQVSAEKGIGKYSKLVEFSTQKLFKNCACVVSARKAKHPDARTMFTCTYYVNASRPIRAHLLS